MVAVGPQPSTQARFRPGKVAVRSRGSCGAPRGPAARTPGAGASLQLLHPGGRLRVPGTHQPQVVPGTRGEVAQHLVLPRLEHGRDEESLPPQELAVHVPGAPVLGEPSQRDGHVGLAEGCAGRDGPFCRRVLTPGEAQRGRQDPHLWEPTEQSTRVTWGRADSSHG